MKRIIFPVLVLSLLLLSEVLYAQPQSRIEKQSHFSPALGVTKNYYLYLPAGYDDTAERYPAVYFFNLQEFSWFNPSLIGRTGGKMLKDVVDNLIETGQIGKIIIVCPSSGANDGSTGGYGVNMLRTDLTSAPGIGSGRFEDYITEDLISHIDSTLQTIPDRSHRAADGFAWGGYTSTMLSLKHPDLFSSVGAYDGALMWYDLDDPNAPGTNDDWLWVLNTSADQWFTPLFDRPRNISYMLLHSASNIIQAADATQLACIQTIRFHLSTMSSDAYDIVDRHLQILDIFRQKGIRNSFSNLILTPNAKDDFGFADLHAATSLVRHWQTFAGYKLNAPLAIDFGVVALGESDTSSVVVFNYGATPLDISSVLNNLTDYKSINLPALPYSLLGRYDTLGFKVIFSPSLHSVLNDTLIIVSNDSANSNTRIALRGRGILIGQAEVGNIYAANSAAASQFFTVNCQSGAATPIAATGVGAIRGLAVHPKTKELYATIPGSPTTSLYRISSQYGEALLLANITAADIRGIAYQSDGSLFGVSTTGRFYQITPSTGTATQIGSTSPGVLYSGLSLNPKNGKLYASHLSQDKIYTIDPSTGVSTLVGSTGLGGNSAISFSPQGVLYGITRSNDFIRIDTTTASGTLIGPIDFPGMSALTMRTDSTLVSVDKADEATLIKTYHLGQNYPNPFNSQTMIEYQIPSAGHVKVSIYNLIGQSVKVLVDKKHQAGLFNLIWDGKDSAARIVPSGVYFYRIEADSFSEMKKMLLLQ